MPSCDVIYHNISTQSISRNQFLSYFTFGGKNGLL